MLGHRGKCALTPWLVCYLSTCAALLGPPATSWAQDTAFTYQGQLKDGGAPADGAYDMVFRIFDADVGGTQHGADYPLPAVAVDDGLFVVDLDFGAGVFTASPRWLEVEVNGQPLTPRQEITATPFAQKCIHAASADYATTAGLAGPWQTDGVNVTYVGGNVGIGTGAPAHPLSVAGMVESTSGGFMFPNGSVQTQAATGGPGFWSASGTNIFNNNAGKIGIGRSDPPDPLSFSNTVGDKIALYGDTGGTYGFGIQGGLLQIHTNNASADIAFGYGPSTAFNERMRVRGNGNVGIGTTAPGAKLHVAGSMKIDGTNTLEFGAGILKEGNAGKIGYQAFGSFDSLDIVGAGTLESNRKINFWNEGGATFKGNVGIGTLAPASKLDITAIGAGAELLRFTTERPWIFRQIYTGSTTGLQLYSTFGSKNFEITCSNGNNCATFYTLDAAPRVGIGTTQPTTTLDVNGTTKTKVLQITGADVAEKFPTSGENAEPGTVMEIDPQTPGQLRMARGAYNRRVAGVVSGANDFPAGAILGHLPGLEDAPAIALSGRVWVKSDACEAAIELGDLLTTSDTPGHAMTASDRDRSHGTVLGKAMTSLKIGERGLVLVLVNLQ